MNSSDGQPGRAQHYPTPQNRFSGLGWLVVLLLIAAALRFTFLDAAPFHHDESIHAWFSHQLWKSNSYIYDPVYHGPFLYWTTAVMYQIFGDSDFTARLLPAVFSLALIVLCWHLRDVLGKIGWIIAAVFITVSPTFTYYGRFLAHDNYVAFFTLSTLLLGILFIQRENKLPLCLLGIILGCFIATKACFYLHLTIFTGFFFFVLLLDTFAPKFPRKLLLQEATAITRKNRVGIITAVILFSLTYTVLYSSFFSNWQGLADGLIQTLSYWGGQQLEPRLPGPFYYYLPRLLIHEPVFYLAIPAVIWAGVRAVRPIDLFLAYWTLAAFFVYSFAQEKVPWLLMHILLPMMLLSGRYIQVLIQKKAYSPWIIVSLTLLLSWSLRENLWLNFEATADHPHLLKYMATEDDIKTVANRITARKESSRKIYITGKATWPLAWYLRDHDIIFDLPTHWQETADMVIIDKTAEGADKTFSHQKYVLSSWWQPDYKQLLTKGLYPYVIKRQISHKKESFRFMMLTRYE